MAIMFTKITQRRGWTKIGLMPDTLTVETHFIVAGVAEMAWQITFPAREGLTGIFKEHLITPKSKKVRNRLQNTNSLMT